MKILHSIAFNLNEPLRDELIRIGVKLKPGAFTVFEIAESDRRWAAVVDVLKGKSFATYKIVKFSENEVLSADWVRLVGKWRHGSFFPDDDEYATGSYDMSGFCSKCGQGRVQRAPFRMAGEPKWGTHKMMELNGLHGELFSSSEFVNSLRGDFDVAAMPVLGPDGSELKTIVQLVPQLTAHVDVQGLEHIICAKCRREKYVFPSLVFPAVDVSGAGCLARADVWLGHGGRAERTMFASRDLAAVLLKVRNVGVGLEPVGFTSAP